MNEFIHYLVIASLIFLPALGVALGQGFAAISVVRALDRQPMIHADARRLFLIALTLTETALILSCFVALLLITTPITPYSALPEIGIALAMAVPAAVAGFVGAGPIYRSMESMARQPFASRNIMTLTLLTQTILQTPVIFGFVIAFILRAQMLTITSDVEAIKLCASGLAFGMGALGPTFGLGYFAQVACTMIGRFKDAYPQILSFTFMSQAMIETPILFALIVSVLMMIFPGTAQSSWISGVSYMAAAISIGLGTLGSGINSGRTASAACREIAKNPLLYTLISRTSMIAQTLIDSGAVYALIISLMLLFVRGM